MAEGTDGKGRQRGKRGAGSKTQLPSGSWQISHPKLARRETYPTEQAAAARLEEINRLVEAKIDVAAGQQTVRVFFTAFLAHRETDPGRAARSLDADERIVAGYILPAIGDRSMDDVRADDLEALLAAVRAGVKERTGGAHDGTRTAQLVATLLTQAFRKAARQRIIPFSPMEGVDIPTYERTRAAPADEAQIAAVLRCALDTPMPALWYSYALLGVRRGEPLGWTWEDYDGRAATVRVRQQVQAVGGALEVVPPKSAASVRTLPVADAHARMFSSLRIRQAEARLRYGEGYDGRGFIFAGPDGRPLWPSTVNHQWYALRTRAGLPTTFKLHHLRHSLSTLVDEAEGVTESLKNAIFGHEARDMSQHYTRARVAAMRKVLEQVWDRVWRAAEDDEGVGT